MSRCRAARPPCDDGHALTASAITGPDGAAPFRKNDSEGEIAGMTARVQGVVATGKGAPVQLNTVLVPDPGPGEALVRVQPCGVCNTDLHYREAGIGDEFPYLLGHEAAG